MLWSTTARRVFRPTLTQSCVATTSAVLHAAAALPVEKAVDAVADTPNTLLTRPAKASFAAAQAIRMCVGNGGLSDGFFVLNSIRFAAYRHQNSTRPFKIPGLTESRGEFEAAALRFGPDVPTRLSAHTLLHSLVRHNLAQPAFELSKLMMQEGTKIRSRTLEAIMKTILASDATPEKLPKGIPFARRVIPVKTAADALLLHPSRMADARTRFALELLFLARRYRQRRTDNMFKAFMAASLLHGELVIFSLLFGWTCRDWQAGYSLASNLAVLHPDDDSSQVAVARLRLDHLRREAIFPSKESLDMALEIINAILARDRHTPSHDREVALQALANIAGLLERRQIPFPKLSALIRTLYKCPRIDDEVWIVGLGGCPERIKAYDYFHRVLSHLLDTFPTKRIRYQPTSVPLTALAQNRRYPMLPPLDVSSCNALVHYALRHRLAPESADKILRFMDKQGKKSSSPDLVTANILLRSGALLRRNDIVVDTLKSMGPTLTFTPDVLVTTPTRTYQDKLEISTTAGLSGSPHSRFGFVRDAQEIGARLGRVQHGDVFVPELPSEADLYTLSSYIAYLSAIGKPREVTEILFTVLPELDSTLFPTNSERKEDRRFGRAALLACLCRAITLGPVFFGTVLDALSKSGQFALADRIWQLAKKAEWCSWNRNHVPHCKPWILGPQAYTTMIRCYGKLARRREPWELTLHPSKRVNLRTSRQSAFAYFIYECQKLPSSLPDIPVLMLLRRVMAHAAFDVFQQFMTIRETYKQLPKRLRWLDERELPAPDAPFFNAALDVFRPRAATNGARPWLQALSEARQAWFDLHAPPPNEDWNEPLEAVARAMLDAGFKLPLSLQSISVGRLHASDHVTPRMSAKTAPFAFAPRKDILQPLHLATPRHKALPTSPAYDHYRQLRVQRWLRRQQRRAPARWQTWTRSRTAAAT
uniref:Uncharacterized protein n=1 Tax=Mycena chlorophos TaxID=658473 RepID=A0ABQ0L519_MYCCL|nr:predicted protein [Mycena chlorophos]